MPETQHIFCFTYFCETDSSSVRTFCSKIATHETAYSLYDKSAWYFICELHDKILIDLHLLIYILS